MLRQELIDAIIQDIAELPNRTSPGAWPEAMLVTSDELYRITYDGSVGDEHGFVAMGGQADAIPTVAETEQTPTGAHIR
jgi:hypothetical protein